jgi:hypothetical protein
MGEKIFNPAIMGDIALPQTAQQELGARGIHLFQKENTATRSGSMECTKKSSWSCTYHGHVKLHIQEMFTDQYTAFLLKYGIHAPANHPQFMASVKTAFFIFTLFCTIGIVASYARGTIR